MEEEHYRLPHKQTSILLYRWRDEEEEHVQRGLWR